MQLKNPVLDDLARLATGAMGAAAGIKGEAEALFRERLARILDSMELVNREEFEAVKAMAARSREEQDRLNERIAALETELAKRAAPKKSAKAKPKATAKAKAKTKAKG
jgi:BMFP domain-containing protein YqiC